MIVGLLVEAEAPEQLQAHLGAPGQHHRAAAGVAVVLLERQVAHQRAAAAGADGERRHLGGGLHGRVGRGPRAAQLLGRRIEPGLGDGALPERAAALVGDLDLGPGPLLGGHVAPRRNAGRGRAAEVALDEVDDGAREADVGRRERQVDVRPALRELIEPAGRQQLVVGVHEGVLEHERARVGAAHAERIPVADDLHAGVVGAHREEAQPLLAGHAAGEVVGVGGAGQRREHLAPVDEEAAGHGRGRRRDAGRGAACDPLRERLAHDRAVVEDPAVEAGADALVPLAHLGRHVEVVGQDPRPERRLAVHVVGQRGRRAEARELGRDVHVVLEARAHAAVALGDAEPEHACIAQLGVVLERERGLAVVARRALGEAGAELAHERERALAERPSRVMRARRRSPRARCGSRRACPRRSGR